MLYALNMFGVVVSAILLSTITDVQSRYVQHPEIRRSVVHKKVIATWDEAKQDCEADGAVLASPLDEEMLEYMRSSIGAHNHSTSYFIGIRATGNTQLVFESVEGVPLDDLPEAVMNMIEPLDPKDGDCLEMDRHNIRVVSCRVQLSYICYKNDTSAPINTVPVYMTTDSKPQVMTETNYDCARGYTLLSGNYYKVHEDYGTYDHAQAGCSAEGSHLAVLNDAHEAQIVTELAFKTSNIWMYIGLRKENNKWQSIFGEPLNELYHQWASTRTGDTCGVLKSNGLIDDMNCTFIMAYICEKQC